VAGAEVARTARVPGCGAVATAAEGADSGPAKDEEEVDANAGEAAAAAAAAAAEETWEEGGVGVGGIRSAGDGARAAAAVGA